MGRSKGHGSRDMAERRRCVRQVAVDEFCGRAHGPVGVVGAWVPPTRRRCTGEQCGHGPCLAAQHRCRCAICIPCNAQKKTHQRTLRRVARTHGALHLHTLDEGGDRQRARKAPTVAGGEAAAAANAGAEAAGGAAADVIMPLTSRHTDSSGERSISGSVWCGMRPHCSLLNSRKQMPGLGRVYGAAERGGETWSTVLVQAQAMR